MAVSEAEKSVARDLYLKGRFEWNKRTPESLNRALDDFTQSIVHDPGSAHTYAGLADTYLLLHEYSLMPDTAAETRSIAAARKAVELDDFLAEAHRSLAFAEVWGNWDFRAGEKEFRRAIALDPRDPLTHLWFATAFNTPEWSAVTRKEFDRAQELDPSSPVILSNKSIWLFEIGERQAGLDLARQVERDDPDFVAPHRYLARMNWDIRNYPEFLVESDKTASLTHDRVLTETTAAARAGFHRDGERGLLHDLYIARKKAHTDGKLAGAPVAEICVRLGKKEEALNLIEDDFDHHRAEFLWILSAPDLIALKGDKRLQEMMSKLNFPGPPSVSQ
jgi:tetratricopeptide (TPR) repeat protein